MLLAAIFVLRNRGEDGIGILVSSKVNQWTLLVATLPTAYNISWIESQSVWEVVGLAMNNQQAIEVFLTAAQSLFAIVLILKLSISVRGAIALFVLFTAQLVLQLVGELFTSLALLRIQRSTLRLRRPLHGSQRRNPGRRPRAYKDIAGDIPVSDAGRLGGGTTPLMLTPAN